MQRFTCCAALAALTLLLVPSLTALAPAADAGRAHSPARSRPRPSPGRALEPGDPLPGLTAEHQAAFEAGVEDFEEVETPEDGLGPVFNARSCVECHAQTAVGGAGPDLTVSRVVRIGTLRDRVFDPLAELGGMLLQQRSIREDLPECPFPGETVPSEATLASLRITPPLFGAGLIEAISVGQIQQRADPTDRDRDGITGVPNRVFNPETSETEVGRFGWKAHVSTLHLFAGDAYRGELGITNPTFPAENLPQGQPIPEGWDPAADLEDDGTGVQALTDFMRFLAPLAPARQTTQTEQGFRVFQATGCAGCHTPSMTTGDGPVAALRRRRVDLFSDLLHDIGPDLADGMEMGAAKGGEWRTAPLWGLSRRLFFLHDGRARTPGAAILAHGGEARRSRDRYAALARRERDALLAFLGSL